MLQKWQIVREDFQFQSYYSSQVDNQIQSGLSFDSVKVDLNLSTLKQVHTGRLVSAIVAIRGDSILVGREESGIKNALQTS